MRFRAALLICAAISGCAQPYTATSANPALIHVTDSGIADLIAVDGQTIGSPTTTDRDFRKIDPGGHQLTVTYQGTVLILNAKLQGGHRYWIVCAMTGWFSVQAHVRDLGTSKIVSNIAEQPFALQTPRPITSPPLAIPVAPRR